MAFDKIIITLGSIAGIVATYLFFLAKKEKEVIVSDAVDIIVDGGYTPDVISVPAHRSTKITFIRKDPNPCLEEVVLADFKIKKHLPLNQKVAIVITPDQSGEFMYSCGMGMYHGKIIVT